MTRSKDPKDEDQALWEVYTKGISPAETSETEEDDFAQMLDDVVEAQEDGIAETITEKRQSEEESLSVRVKKTPHAPQLDKRTDERLRKGKIAIEARLDLHGYRQSEAHEALDRFIQDAANAGKRCVLVITGKGKSTSTSEDWLSPAEGVLKQRVPEWLSGRALRPYILKVYPAMPQHGGSGALYVYLKKNL